MDQAWSAEVHDLHRFFEDWLNGRVERTESVYGRLREALAEGFEMVTPDGRRLTREALLESLWEAHGRHGDPPLCITVKNVSVSPLAPGLAAVAYEEWQSSAAGETARRSTAILGQGPAGAGRPLWIRVQETWMRPE